TGGTADRNRSHWSTSKTPSYTKSVSWQHHPGHLHHSLSMPVILNKNSINFYSSLAPYVSCYITVQEHLNIICRAEWQL
ncbi:hypothetical protein, partial [Shigella sonnei]|uniref:hypothetical protein n=1 Tax=Shigella sonnei TaxID=624 RepID=UPI001C0A7CC6